MHRIGGVSVVALALGLTPALVPESRAQSNAPEIPLAKGLVIVETLHDSGAERESIVTVEEASSAGVRYLWRFLEVHTKGDTIKNQFARFVGREDLAAAPRWHAYYETDGAEEHPGYTAYTISTAIYRRLRAQGSDSFQVMSLDTPGGASGALAQLGFGGRGVPVRWRGTLTWGPRKPEPFPLLVNGRRVSVPALRLQGRFMARQREWNPEIWVLADSAHPLLLKLADGRATLQTIRVDWLADDDGSGELAKSPRKGGEPGALAAAGGGLRGPAAMIERDLESACRVELPGIYFAFNSAGLDPASDRTIAALARTLERHSDWKPTIEGHTDSIGSAAANQALSERRAQAVRSRLVSHLGARGAAFGATGFGASRPRESNATIEGRARNRRVELARDCK